MSCVIKYGEKMATPYVLQGKKYNYIAYYSIFLEPQK